MSKIRRHLTWATIKLAPGIKNSPEFDATQTTMKLETPRSLYIQGVSSNV